MQSLSLVNKFELSDFEFNVATTITRRVLRLKARKSTQCKWIVLMTIYQWQIAWKIFYSKRCLDEIASLFDVILHRKKYTEV